MSATVESPKVDAVAAEIVTAVLAELGEDLGERGVREELVTAVRVILVRAIGSSIESAVDQIIMEMGEMDL